MLPLLSLAFAIAALVLFSSHYIIFRRLLSLALQFPSYRVTSLSAAPVELRQLAAPTLEKLKTLGFQAVAACNITPLIYQGGATEWELLLERHGSFAHIALRHPLEAYAPTKVTFFSFLQNQHLLLTLNGEAHGLIGKIPATTLADAYSPDLAQQWQHHQQLMEQSPVPVQPLTPAAYGLKLTQHFSQYLAQLKKQGKIQPVIQASIPNTLTPRSPTPQSQTSSQRLFQLSIPTALTCCKNIATQGGKAAALAKSLVTSGPGRLPLMSQVQSFERMQRMERGSIQRPSCDRGLFLISLALFMVSFRSLFDPAGLVIFVAAIALHEGGHHWAMRCFGYENTTIFFLPFLGAAATGHKDKASLGEKVLVLLAGPVPGILLGSLLLFIPRMLPQLQGHGLIHEASYILLGLNFFNLLPIYPLDGGKVVHLLFFSRVPYWDALFKMGAICCLLLLGLLSPILLALAAIVALSIPQSLRSAKLYLALKTTTPAHSNSPQDYLKKIFQQQEELGFDHLSFNQRYGLTKDLWARRGETQARWPTYFALSLLYLLFLFGAPTGFILAQFNGTETAANPSLTRPLPATPSSSGVSRP